MWKDLIKQMIPFAILLLLLWVVAILLERPLVEGPRILAPPVESTSRP